MDDPLLEHGNADVKIGSVITLPPPYGYTKLKGEGDQWMVVKYLRTSLIDGWYLIRNEGNKQIYSRLGKSWKGTV